MKRILFLLLLISTGLFTSCSKDDDIFDPVEQFEKEQKNIDRYIAENGLNVQKDSVHQLRYFIESQGTGIEPKGSDVITVSLTAKLLSNGNIVDEWDSTSVILNQWFPAWQVLLPYLKEGGKMTMFIPSYYAYGTQELDKIPANSTLIHDVQLHMVETLAEFEPRQFQLEQQAIDEYLESMDLVAEIDTVESLRYIITKEGTGNYPRVTDRINLDYSGKLLADGQIFDSGNDRIFTLNSLVTGWKILLPYVKEGGSVRIFLPSKFAYGISGYGSIPGNSTLVFDITLNAIE